MKSFIDKKIITLLLLFFISVLASCSSLNVNNTDYNPTSLRFSGEQALRTLITFVEQFPYRHSGQLNSYRATNWLRNEFTRYGLVCQIDGWEIINYNKPVQLRNVIAELPGKSPREILIIAHHDQSPDTIQGADNDGSGIAILLQLAEIFSSEQIPKYKLVFLATDAEEFGMIGTRRYIETHQNIDNIIAAISLDNLGKEFYNGMSMSPVGQLRGYGPLWLLLTCRGAAKAAGNLWIPKLKSPLEQALEQAVPISKMDQGPIIAKGVPALGLAGITAEKFKETDWETYHTPKDTIEYQSSKTLYQSGAITEALLRELLTLETFPQESGPYLYFESSNRVLRGLPLWAIFVTFVLLFFVGSFLKDQKSLTGKFQSCRAALFHFLGLWLPLLFSIMLLYLFVFVGLMDKFHLYPATAKDELIFQPKWPAVVLFLAGLALFLLIGRISAKRYYEKYKFRPTRNQVNSLALFIIGLAGVYILIINPFSLIFLIPVLFWLFIEGRQGAGKALDIALFVLGGLIVYLLLYFFGFVILRNNFVILWYLMMMFSIQMISFPTIMMITAVVAAGLSMIINPPGLKSS